MVINQNGHGLLQQQKEEEENVATTMNGNKNGKIMLNKDKQQGIRLLDENGSDYSENGSNPNHQTHPKQQYSIDQMLLRPVRVWRPTARERRTGWAWSSVGSGAAGKRRKRLARLAALAGMVALGIGLLLLLWLAIMPTNRKELGLKNGGHKTEMAENSTTENIGISTLLPPPPPSSPPNSPSNGHKIDLNSTNISASISPKIVSTTVGTSLLNIYTASQPNMPQRNQQKFRLSIVQKNGKKQRPNIENNVIRVTAPAGRQIEFDRMVKIKNEEPKGNGSHIVRAKLEKGREWGILERQNGNNLDQIQEENGSARIEKEMPGSNFSSAEKGIANVANSSEESRTKEEEEDFDDLFWLHEKPRVTDNLGQKLPSNVEILETTTTNVIDEESSTISTFMTSQNPESHSTASSIELENSTLNVPMPTAAETDGYEAKRPTIEFGPVRAEDETVEQSDELFGRTTRRPPTIGQIGDEWKGNRRVEEELNEIIASVEREPRPTPTMFHHGHHPLPYGPPSSSMEEDIIHPVEIPFDPFYGAPAGITQSSSPVPIWRRPPPDESSAEEWSPPPPPPPPPPMPMPNRNFTLQATVRTRQFIGSKELIKERQNLRRKRREAPVLVTALLDIGRGKWQRFTRHFDQYLGYLTNILLRLQNNIVLFCDPAVTEYLRALGNRTLDWERIQIVETSLSELPFYKYRPEIEEIMRWEQKNWQRDWDQQMREHPETLYPDYDILVNSKPYFLYNATLTSRFPRPIGRSEQFFAWLDAGYGHGSASAIPKGVWMPPALRSGQITLVKLPTLVERVERYTLDKVYRKQRSVVSGGFLAGDDRVIRRFWIFFQKIFIELLDENKVDDDQTTLLVTIQKYNSTFNLLQGGWFDAFKLLSSSSNSNSSQN